jgi:hypothetical protein
MAIAVDSVTSSGSSVSRTSLWTRLPWAALLERWHLLSLDAPTVSALWCWFLARTMHIHLPWHAPMLLALGTWLLYVADRILDGARTNAGSPLQERHRFHSRHRMAFLVAAVAGSGVLLWLIIDRMSTRARYEDTVLFLAAGLYFMLVHQPRLGSPRWLPKELAVGIIFASATAVPAWSRMAHSHNMLLPGIAAFAALCWLNCVAIERWENLCTATAPGDHAHATTFWVARHFSAIALTLSLLTAAIGLWFCFGPGTTLPNPAPIYLAVSSAVLLLVLIDRRRDGFSRLHLRIAADVALLTPLLFVSFLN